MWWWNNWAVKSEILSSGRLKIENVRKWTTNPGCSLRLQKNKHVIITILPPVLAADIAFTVIKGQFACFRRFGVSFCFIMCFTLLYGFTLHTFIPAYTLVCYSVDRKKQGVFAELSHQKVNRKWKPMKAYGSY